MMSNFQAGDHVFCIDGLKSHAMYLLSPFVFNDKNMWVGYHGKEKDNQTLYAAGEEQMFTQETIEQGLLEKMLERNVRVGSDHLSVFTGIYEYLTGGDWGGKDFDAWCQKIIEQYSVTRPKVVGRFKKYRAYNIEKNDAGEEVKEDFLLLIPKKDAAARVAIRAYAREIWLVNSVFHDDLDAWIDRLDKEYPLK